MKQEKNMKRAIALAFMIAAFAIAAFAFGSPPTATKEQPAAVKTAPASSISQAMTVIAKIDASLAMPVEQVALAGEKTKAEAIARRAAVTSDTYVEQWIADVPTPPNKTAFKGFANTRAREQV
jgi:transcriptional regulator of nitric oxide reductase